MLLVVWLMLIIKPNILYMITQCVQWHGARCKYILSYCLVKASCHLLARNSSSCQHTPPTHLTLWDFAISITHRNVFAVRFSSIRILWRITSYEWNWLCFRLFQQNPTVNYRTGWKERNVRDVAKGPSWLRATPDRIRGRFTTFSVSWSAYHWRNTLLSNQLLMLKGTVEDLDRSSWNRY